jgi:hypothetical protein
VCVCVCVEEELKIYLVGRRGSGREGTMGGGWFAEMIQSAGDVRACTWIAAVVNEESV